MAISGANLFVLNRSGSSVTEIDASTGKMVKVISGPAYRFDDLAAVAIGDGRLFVVSAFSALGKGPGLVTEIDAATGKMVKVISGSGYHFAAPGAIVVDWPKLFVANSDSVTEFQASG
jgi:hypothetical protein